MELVRDVRSGLSDGARREMSGPDSLMELGARCQGRAGLSDKARREMSGPGCLMELGVRCQGRTVWWSSARDVRAGLLDGARREMPGPGIQRAPAEWRCPTPPPAQLSCHAAKLATSCRRRRRHNGCRQTNNQPNVQSALAALSRRRRGQLRARRRVSSRLELRPRHDSHRPSMARAEGDC